MLLMADLGIFGKSNQVLSKHTNFDKGIVLLSACLEEGCFL